MSAARLGPARLGWFVVVSTGANKVPTVTIVVPALPAWNPKGAGTTMVM